LICIDNLIEKPMHFAEDECSAKCAGLSRGLCVTAWNAGAAQDPIVDKHHCSVITLCGKMLTMQLEASSRGECNRVLRGVPAMMDNRFSRRHVFLRTARRSRSAQGVWKYPLAFEFG